MKPFFMPFLLLLLISGSMIHHVSAQDKQTIQLVNQLKSPLDSVRNAALDQLVEKKDTATYPLLEAISQRKLYLDKDIYVTIGEKQLDKDGTKRYPLYRVYPTTEQVVYENGKPVLKELDELEEVKFSRVVRLKVQPLVPYFRLVSPLPEKRKSAYMSFRTTADTSVIPLLRKALKDEKVEKVKRYGREAIYAIKLHQGDLSKEEKIQLVDSIKTNIGPSALQLLEEYAEKCKEEGEEEVHEHAKKAVLHLESRGDKLTVIQNLFSGISLGSILILIALGLSVIYGLAGVINMAHGEFLMIGAYTTYVIQEIFHKSFGMVNSDLFFWISLPMAFVVAGTFGLVIERFIIRYLYDRPLEGMLATWGVGLVLIQLARTIFGDLTSVDAPVWVSGGWEVVPQLVLPYNRLFIIGLTAVMIILTYLMLFRSRLGLCIRSVTQNRPMSSCLGIATRKVDSITFFLGTGLAGTAGAAMTLIGNVVPDMGQTYIVDSFLVVVTGGVGKLTGVVLSGLGIGSLTKLIEPGAGAVYGKVLILVVIILFLQFKPKGLFPSKGRLEDH